MNEYTIPMAIVDFIPVILFAITAVILQRDLYPKMGKGNYALFASGTIMCVVAGIFKASWKLLYAAGICDFQRLTQSFMPMQSTGFFFAGLAAFAMMFTKAAKEQGRAVVTAEKFKPESENEGERLNMTALPLFLTPAVLLGSGQVPAYTSSMVFIIAMVFGLALLIVVLCIAAARLRKIHVLIFFIVAFVLLLSMGYMGSSAFEARMEGKIALKNWIEESINTAAQILLLLGVIGLHRGGFKELCMHIKAKKA